MRQSKKRAENKTGVIRQIVSDCINNRIEDFQIDAGEIADTAAIKYWQRYKKTDPVMRSV